MPTNPPPPFPSGLGTGIGGVSQFNKRLLKVEGFEVAINIEIDSCYS